jgi:hypothetical protein
VCVYPRAYNSILTIGDIDDDCGYTTHYCYENPVQAIIAAEEWNPNEQAEPENWKSCSLIFFKRMMPRRNPISTYQTF